MTAFALPPCLVISVLRPLFRVSCCVTGAVGAARKPKLMSLRHSLLQYAHTHCGFSKEFARKVIGRFDAEVRDADKDIIFNNLVTDSECRIMVSRVSLGMGIDIPDIIRVV